MARPKLKPGEKGRYNVSRVRKKKQEVQRKLRDAKKQQEALEKKVAKLQQTKTKQVNGQKIASSGGATTQVSHEP